MSGEAEGAGPADGRARVEIASETALWDWLAAHHGQADSVWLVTWKKRAGAVQEARQEGRHVRREAVLDALVAHGWVDGRRMKLDAERTMQLIAPRRQQAWAASYKVRAARLEAEGRMHRAGRASVAAGRASGLWTHSDDVDALSVPEDLAAALRAAPPAAAHWEGFAPSKRRNVLRWIKAARRPETRARRIAEVARLAATNRTPPQM